MTEYLIASLFILIAVCAFLYRKNITLATIAKEQKRIMESQKKVADVRKNHIENSLADNIDIVRSGEF